MLKEVKGIKDRALGNVSCKEGGCGAVPAHGDCPDDPSPEMRWAELTRAVAVRGVDVDQFGTDRYRTLKEFWLDLTAKESLLQMSGGKPLRLADSTARPAWLAFGLIPMSRSCEEHMSHINSPSKQPKAAIPCGLASRCWPASRRCVSRLRGACARLTCRTRSRSASCTLEAEV